MNRKCWRCDAKDTPLVHDPMMPPGDQVGVCRPCAEERFIVMRVYVARGKRLVICEPDDDSARAWL